MRKTLAAGLVAGLLATLAPAAAAAPMTVWEDEEGDAFLGDATLAPVFGGAGFDLASGSLEVKDGNLEFTVVHAQMPPFGNVPEAARFIWAFNVDGTDYRITVKRADIGKPDVVAGQTTERLGRVDVNGHFRLEGECATEAAPAVFSFVNCKPLGYFEGSYDTAAKTFVFPLPLDAVGAKPGSKVIAGGGDAIGICGVCWVSHYAERSLQATVIDQDSQEKSFTIPGGKKKKKKKK
ncbi:MAG TPA: hypothetical protein VM573_01750 [Actinomycetota bacterium]|jgi:hypothetical protein|nr:hypothetical protein [Actinomycetota bacterium]